VNFKTLAGFERRPPASQTAVQSAFYQALYCLEQARQQDFQAPHLMRQTLEHLQQAIAQDPRQLEAHLVLAGLLLLLGQADQALKSLNQARALAPEGPRVLEMLGLYREYLQLQQQPEAQLLLDVLADFRQQQQPLPAEQHQAWLEQLIPALIQQEMQIPETFRPDHTSARLQQLIQAVAEREQRLSELQAQLSLLERESDTLGLHLQLRPLEQNLLRYRQAEALCRRFVQIQRACDRTVLSTERLLEQVRQFRRAGGSCLTPEWESALNELLDRCDLIADQLDALAAEGHDHRCLDPGYAFLLQQVGGLQETLEEWD
jgi:hypothetical protein